MADERIEHIEIARIHQSPWQGRFLELDKENSAVVEKGLEELCASITQSGVMNPVVLRPHGDSGFELVDGHRRVAACRRLGWHAIPAVVRSMDDRAAQSMSIAANLQRKDLKPLELARAYRKVLDSGLFPNNRELSKAIGKHESFVGEVLNMLKMDSRILDDLAKASSINDIRLLRAIRRCGAVDATGVSEPQWVMYRRVVDEGLQRADVLKLARGTNKSASTGTDLTVRVGGGGKRITVTIETALLSKEQRKTLKVEMKRLAGPMAAQAYQKAIAERKGG